MGKIESLDLRRAERRMITDIPGIERPGYNWTGVVGLGGITLPFVTIDSTLMVPALSAAVSFLSRSLANLSLQLNKTNEAGSERVTGGLATLDHCSLKMLNGISALRPRLRQPCSQQARQE